MLFGHHDIAVRPTTGCGFVARIAFDYGLKRYEIGDVFDWRAIGITEGQASDLWSSGHLVVKPATAIAAATPTKKGGR